MSLRPFIARLWFSFWATRRHVPSQFPLARRVEHRTVATHLLPLELQESISSGAVKQLKGLHNELKVALAKGNIDDLCYSLASSRRIFFTLPKQAWQHVRDNHLQLTKPQLEEVARVLAGRCRKGDAEVLGQLLRDAKAMYGVEPSPELLHSALNALVRTGRQAEAYDLLQLFHNYKQPPFRPDSRHWRAAMWGLAQIGDVEKLQECLSIMKSSWPFPGNSHYRCILEGLFRSAEPPSKDKIFQILDEINKFRLPYDDGVYMVLVKLTERYGFDSLLSEYKKRFNSHSSPSEPQTENWLKELIACRKTAKAKFEWKLRAFRHEGFIPDERTLSKLVHMLPVATSEELLYHQEILELPPNVISWSICLRNALEKNGWRSALAVYNTAKAQGIKPDAAMMHPLLRAMCSRYVQEPPEPVLDQALDLYKDLTEEAKYSGMPGADTGVFNTLLRALAASKNKQKFFPVAFQLLEDMRLQGIYMDRMTATSVAVLLVRSSSTYEEAAEAYKQVHKVNADGLDAKGFAAVLHAFCSLEPDGLPPEACEAGISEGNENEKAGRRPFPIPPASLYSEILQDMYGKGLRKTAEVYTILLGRYAALATRARAVRNPVRREYIVRLLRKAIKQTHRQISVEAGLEPDAPLLNQLMDTYNRAGLIRDVMQVWTMLNSTGLVSSASVSILFDACGYHKQTDQADVIFRDLKERGFKFNIRNWNSWIECLCRLNRLDEALQVVCSEMTSAEDREQRPDSQTVKILLSFASVYGRLEEVRTRLKAHLPNLV